MRILVVEDDKYVGGFVLRGLKEAGHLVELADNGPDGLFMAASEAFDAIILDRDAARRDRRTAHPGNVTCSEERRAGADPVGARRRR